MIRLAYGSKAILDGEKTKAETLPTTCHILIGESCPYSCSYCSAANASPEDESVNVARIKWTEMDENELLEKMQNSSFQRACLQVFSGNEEKALELAEKIKKPISICLRNVDDDFINGLKNKKNIRICISLDGVNGSIGKKVGRGDFEKSMQKLEELANSEEFKGRISTHLIIGLGESEKEAVETMAKLARLGIKIGLFAFYPAGKMAQEKQVHIGKYRRMQIARAILEKNPDFAFSHDSRGNLLLNEETAKLIKPYFFQTSGCNGCNRPYYDHSPRRIYNYARELKEGEFEKAKKECQIYEEKVIYKGKKLLKIDFEKDLNLKRLNWIRIRGDFFAHPEEIIETMEKELEGSAFDRKEFEKKAGKILKENNAQLFGITIEDMAKSIFGENA